MACNRDIFTYFTVKINWWKKKSGAPRIVTAHAPSKRSVKDIECHVADSQVDALRS
jgi:hypothetical protein